jgi:hypothetical protein
MWKFPLRRFIVLWKFLCGIFIVSRFTGGALMSRMNGNSRQHRMHEASPRVVSYGESNARRPRGRARSPRDDAYSPYQQQPLAPPPPPPPMEQQQQQQPLRRYRTRRRSVSLTLSGSESDSDISTGKIHAHAGDLIDNRCKFFHTPL